MPKRSIDSAFSRKSPRCSKSSGRPKTWTRSPFFSPSRSASKRERCIVTPSDAPLSGSFSVKKTVCQASCRRSSVTSPSTHTVGSRVSQEPTPRLKDATV